MGEKKTEGQNLILSKTENIFSNKDFTNMDLSNCDYTNYTFENCIFDKANFTNSVLHNVKAEYCSFIETNFTNADISSGNFRYADLHNSDISGANCYYALFEYTNLDEVKYNDRTKFYKLHCPEEGGFVAYKKCVENRVVTLYIPKDAKRTSATGITCRTNKVKVLMIESFDGNIRYEEAYSFVEEDFCYKVGQTIEVKDFNEDRWMDSTTGIHFFMTKEEAKAY